MDPINFGPTPVAEAGVGSPSFPELNVPVWFSSGAAPSDASAELGVTEEAATVRTLPEEGGTATVGATIDSVVQARIIIRGAWDAVFLDAFDAVAPPSGPCSLILELFEEDEVTVAWAVGTSPAHPNPYLMEAQNYGAQEIDVIAGAATIGQVEVVVIDKAQTPGDQDSGWLTERLTDGGVPAIRGRRARLTRFISEEEGFVVIADGPAGVPRMDSSFAAYQFVIKDVREAEREIRAFTRSEAWLAPLGSETGFGRFEDEEGATQWLVEPTEPLVGVYRETDFLGRDEPSGGDWAGYLVLEDYFPDGLNSTFFWRPSNGDAITGREVEMTHELRNLALSEIENIDRGLESGEGNKALHSWPELELLWRPEGTEDAWTVLSLSWHKFLTGADYPTSPITMLSTVSSETGSTPHTYELPGGSLITAIGGTVQIRGPDEDSFISSEGGYMGQLTEGANFPTIGQRVEFALRFIGEPTEQLPLYVEIDDDGSDLTAGRLLKKLYDGEFSDRDPATGAIVSTGIRYDEDALLLLTDPVRMRVTEPVEDLRDWTEQKIYGPTGWAPSLDNELEISPSSQVIPESFEGYPEFSDAEVEPVAVWNAGEIIVNFLEFTYPRWIPSPPTGEEQAESVDSLERREVIFQFRSEESLTKKEEKQEYDGEAFAAIGDNLGGALEASETGALLALDRKFFVFERYQTGAQTIEIPVRRSVAPPSVKPGSWVVVSLSWLPDYVLMRRGALWGGQIVAIHDVDCAWRSIMIEEAVPLEPS